MSSSWPCELFWNANSSRILPSGVLTHATQRVLWTSSPTLFMGVSLTSCVGWPTATCINSSFHASGSPVRVVAESEPIHQTSRQAAQRASRAWPATHQFEKLVRRELPGAENFHLDTFTALEQQLCGGHRAWRWFRHRYEGPGNQGSRHGAGDEAERLHQCCWL